MSIVIEILGAPLHGNFPIPMLLVECDVDAPVGTGAVVFSNSPTRAMKFEDVVDAIKYIQRQSTVKPLRVDGKPNKPLTAWTITFHEVV